MSELVQRLIGSLANESTPEHPLASIVEERLAVDPAIRRYLASMAERPMISSLHVMSVSTTHAECRCEAKIKDNENPRYFTAEVLFSVDLATGACQRH